MFSEHGRGELCSPAGDRRSPLALRESNPFGLKRKIACLTVLKKLDNSLIACTFLPCNPTYFLV